MKETLKTCLFCFCIIICGINTCFSQKYNPKYLRENDKALLSITSSVTNNGWIEFRRDKGTEAINPDTFFERFGKNLGLGGGYQMRLLKDETDFREIRHQRYELYYKNIRVESVEYSLHSRDKRLEIAHGRIVEDLVLDVDKPMSERKALEFALSDLKLSLDDVKGKDLPKGELLIARLGEEVVSQNFRLCYAFDIRIGGLERKEGYSEPQRVYVDAATGQIVRRDPLTLRCFNAIHHHPNQPTLPVYYPNGIGTNGHASKPLIASTFTPSNINNNRYFNAQGAGSFETEQIGAQYRLSLQNTALIVRDANNLDVSNFLPTYTHLWRSRPDIFNSSPV